jgi:hypothetical protein
VKLLVLSGSGRGRSGEPVELDRAAPADVSPRRTGGPPASPSQTFRTPAGDRRGRPRYVTLEPVGLHATDRADTEPTGTGEPSEARPTAARAVVCRGCCCGTHRKHPGIAHREQIRLLQEKLGTRIKVSGCLGACSRSNVIVVLPARAARRGGARPVWLGEILTRTLLGAVADWVLAGGPGIADPPSVLRSRVFGAARSWA